MCSLKSMLMAAGCLAGALTALGADSAGIGKLEGKWTTKRTSSNGQEVAQTIEIKGDKLTFQILNADKEVRLFATGKVKAETVGPFNVLKLTQIEAGRSADETQAVDDDRSNVYVLSGDTLTLASNFDKERENQAPRVDVYQRVATPKASSSPDSGKAAGK